MADLWIKKHRPEDIFKYWTIYVYITHPRLLYSAKWHLFERNRYFNIRKNFNCQKRLEAKIKNNAV
jgi:hypothetical protein